jgi:hypothetical protein
MHLLIVQQLTWSSNNFISHGKQKTSKQTHAPRREMQPELALKAAHPIFDYSTRKLKLIISTDIVEI